MKKIIIIIGIIAIAIAVGTILSQSKQPTQDQTQSNSSKSEAQGLEQTSNSKAVEEKTAPAGSPDGVISALQAEADREAGISSELEVDSSSFDAEIIEASNIENAYEANKF